MNDSLQERVFSLASKGGPITARQALRAFPELGDTVGAVGVLKQLVREQRLSMQDQRGGNHTFGPVAARPSKATGVSAPVRVEKKRGAESTSGDTPPARMMSKSADYAAIAGHLCRFIATAGKVGCSPAGCRTWAKQHYDLSSWQTQELLRRLSTAGTIAAVGKTCSLVYVHIAAPPMSPALARMLDQAGRPASGPPVVAQGANIERKLTELYNEILRAERTALRALLDAAEHSTDSTMRALAAAARALERAAAPLGSPAAALQSPSSHIPEPQHCHA